MIGYKIINVDDWQEDPTLQASGTRDKAWFIEPEQRRNVLVKWPKYGLGEIYAEKIAYEIAKKIGLSAAKTEIGSLNNDFVILSYRFLEPKDSFIEGGEFFEERFGEWNREAKLAPNYTFAVLKDILYPMGLFENLLEMVVFDCLIGNQDRHQDNWGVIKRENKIVFAPLYDHSSCLGWNLPEVQIERLLRDDKLIEDFVNRSESCVRWEAGARIKHFRLIRLVLETEGNTVRDIIEKLTDFDDDCIGEIVENVPDAVMPHVRKDLVFRLLKVRRDRLKELILHDKGNL